MGDLAGVGLEVGGFLVVIVGGDGDVGLARSAGAFASDFVFGEVVGVFGLNWFGGGVRFDFGFEFEFKDED